MYSEGNIPSKPWRNKPPTVNGSAREESITEGIVKNNGLAVQFKKPDNKMGAIFTKSNEKRY